jgi:hypothetical protein
MKDLDLWPLVWGALDALTAHYGPAIDNAAAELGIPVGEWYGWLMAARIFEPEPVSAPRLRVRSAYTAPAKLESALAKGAQLGLLETVKDGEYHLTDAGRSGVQHLIKTAYGAMSSLQPLPQSELLRLAGLLQRIVLASLAAPEPPGKWCLRIARHYDPGDDAAVMERLDQYLSDLVAYRDDAHLAAWQPYGVSGQAWETLTLLWLGSVKTLDELCEKLAARRGFAREDYAAAVQELMARGWITEDADGYSVTDSGRVLRQEGETRTNGYFYGPWGRLSEAEVSELRDLLIRFRTALHDPQG